MPTISLKLITYNEAFYLPHSLKTVLPYVDEAIIVDGGPEGPSTDATLDVLEGFRQEYPDKVKYFAGTYRAADGSWDEMTQANRTLEHITSDFLMLHHSDIIYDEEDMAKIREAVEKFPDKKVFHCNMIEFFYDMQHVRLYPNSIETLLPKPITGDVPIISMAIHPRYVGNAVLDHDGFTVADTLFMPDVKRYHFGWVKPFEKQVEKHFKYMKHVRKEEAILAGGDEAIMAWAVEHVLSYATDPSKFDYYGSYPSIVDELGLHDISSMDGYEEFLLAQKEDHSGA